MNRILQIILGIIILQHLFALVMILSFLPAQILNFPKATKSFNYPKGQQKFESTMSIGDLKLSQTMEYDTLAGKGVRSLYAGLPNISTDLKINGRPYVIGSDGNPIEARWTGNGNVLEVPVSAERYRSLLMLSFGIMLVYLIVLVYMMVELFRFSRKAGRQEFFEADNRKRLRLFGTFMILTALVSYLTNTSTGWLLHQITGTHGYRHHAPSSGGSFPAALVAGLLLFIIASAFDKGQYLQKEQDLTI